MAGGDASVIEKTDPSLTGCYAIPNGMLCDPYPTLRSGQAGCFAIDFTQGDNKRGWKVGLEIRNPCKGPGEEK